MSEKPRPSLNATAAHLTAARMADLAPETVELGVSLVRASHSHATRSEAVLHAPRGLTWLSFRMLYLIWLIEPVTAGELARLLGVSRQTTSNALRSLETDELISRARDSADQRRITIRVKDEARARVEDLVHAQFRLDMHWFGALDEADQQVLARLLERLRRSIEGRAVDLGEILPPQT